MSVDIRGYLLGHISHDHILNTIKSIYDSNAYFRNLTTKDEGLVKDYPIQIVDYYGDDGRVYTTSGWIMFKIPGERWERGIFYYYMNANTYEMIIDSIESGYQLSRERIDIDASETTILMMKYVEYYGYANTEDVIRNIMNHLCVSGWIGDDASFIFQSYKQILKFN